MDLSGWDTSSVTDTSSMFSGCSSLASVDLSGWDTSSVTDTSYMFYGCSSLASLDLSGWDTSSVHRSDFMVYGCYHLAEVALGNRFTRYFLILPTPSSDYIPGATGLWYGPDGTGYRPADIPVGVAATYTALPPATAAPAAQPADLEEPPALALAFSLYPGGLLEVCPCGSDPSVPGEPLASWELPGDARLASAADAPWAEYASQVLEVRVLDGVRPSSCAHWFSGMSNCARFDLAGLDTSVCSDFTGMFEGCDPEAGVVLGPLFSAAGDGTCAPCELPAPPETPGADAATGEPVVGDASIPVEDVEESDNLDRGDADEGNDDSQLSDGLGVSDAPVEESPATSESNPSEAGVADAGESEASSACEGSEAALPEGSTLDEGTVPDPGDNVGSELTDTPEPPAIEEALTIFPNCEEDAVGELPMGEDALGLTDSEIPLAA